MAAGWVWLNYIAATTYVIYGLGVSQLGDLTQKIVVPGAPRCLRCPRWRGRLQRSGGAGLDRIARWGA